MLSTNDQKVRFKMYKSGKIWITAGVIVLTWSATSLTSQAAVVNDQPTSGNVAGVTDGKTGPTKAVVLPPAGTTQAATHHGKQSVPETIKPSAKGTSDQPAERDPQEPQLTAKLTERYRNDSQEPATKPSAMASPKVDAPSTIPSDTKSLATSESTPNTTKPPVNDTNNGTSKREPSTNQAPAKLVGTATGNQVNRALQHQESSTSSKTDFQASGVTVPEQSATSVVNADQPTGPLPVVGMVKTNQPVVDLNATTRQDKVATDYADYHRETNLDHGVNGTSEWWIDADNGLHIGAGQLDATNVWAALAPNDGDTDYSEAFQPRENQAARDYVEFVQPWGVQAGDVTSLKFEGKVVADADASGLFMNMTSLSAITGLDQLDTSQVTNMAFMFSGDASLKMLDLTGFNTSRVTNMQNTFYGMEVLQGLDLTPLDTSQVTTMAGMLGIDTSLKTVNLSTLNTSKVTDMAGLFMTDESLQELDLSHFDTRQVKYMTAMFSDMTALTKVNLASFNTTNTKDMAFMFSGDDNLIEINIGHFDMTQVNQMQWLLNGTPLRIGLSANTILTLDKDYVDEHNDIVRPQLAGLHTFSTDEAHDGKWYTGKWFDTKTHQVYTTEALVEMYREIGHGPTATYQQQTNLELQDSVIKLGTDWHASHNFVSATDVDGSQVTIDSPKITVTQHPDTNRLGKQLVSYTFLNSAGFLTERQAQVIVTGITLKETSKKISTTTAWSPRDNVKLAVDAQGSEVNASAIVIKIVNNHGQTVTEFKTPGTYMVSYQISGEPDSVVTMPLTVYSLAAIHMQDSAINLGTPWHAGDNFSAVDENGHALTVHSTGVSVVGQPDTDMPGNYPVTYTYTDASGHTVSKAITVTVAGIQLKQQRVTAITTDHWQPATNLQRAVNADGQRLTAADLKIVTAVSKGGRVRKNATLTTPGIYLVTYQFSDRLGVHQAQTQVEIVSHASVVARDQTLNVGETWQPRAGFVRATDEYGRPLSWEAIKVSGNVATHRAGEYPVQYVYTDAAGNQTQHNTVVTVLDQDTDVDLGGDSGDDKHPDGGHNEGDSGNDKHPGDSGAHDKTPGKNNDGQRPGQGEQLVKPVVTRPDQSKPVSLPQTSEASDRSVETLLGLAGLVVSGYLALAARFKRN